MDDTDDKKNAKEVKKSTITNCRMYESKYPKVDDLVMVEVKSIEEMGAYVALKEYNDIEGMILLSELSRRRIRSINKIIRVGRLEVVVVLRVDEDKGKRIVPLYSFYKIIFSYMILDYSQSDKINP